MVWVGLGVTCYRLAQGCGQGWRKRIHGNRAICILHVFPVEVLLFRVGRRERKREKERDIDRDRERARREKEKTDEAKTELFLLSFCLRTYQCECVSVCLCMCERICDTCDT